MNMIIWLYTVLNMVQNTMSVMQPLSTNPCHEQPPSRHAVEVAEKRTQQLKWINYTLWSIPRNRLGIHQHTRFSQKWSRSMNLSLLSRFSECIRSRLPINIGIQWWYWWNWSRIAFFSGEWTKKQTPHKTILSFYILSGLIHADRRMREHRPTETGSAMWVFRSRARTQ